GLLKTGNHEAAQPLWERYFQQLVRLARGKLHNLPGRAADEEDVALSAFNSFCRGALRGRFPQLKDKDNLSPLLGAITARKAINLRTAERRQKRGGGAVRGESAWLGPPGSEDSGYGIDQVTGPEPTPEFATQVAEECRQLLEKLDNAELRAVALWKMEGY